MPAELRRVPPESFVAARDALSRRLRQAGDREGAAEVRRLRRPSAPLWALNQLSESAADRVTELVHAGEALRATTRAALEGGQAELGRLSNRHARLVDELTGRAMQLIAGLPAPATSESRSRLWTMLRVASLDPGLAAGLVEGSLAEEPVSAGFDSLLGFDLGSAPSGAERGRHPAPAGTSGEKTEATKAARQRREHAEEVRAARARVEAAHKEEAARRERLDEARGRLAGLRKQARAAERETERLQQDLKGAEQAAQSAQEALDRLRADEGE